MPLWLPHTLAGGSPQPLGGLGQRLHHPCLPQLEVPNAWPKHWAPPILGQKRMPTVVCQHSCWHAGTLQWLLLCHLSSHCAKWGTCACVYDRHTKRLLPRQLRNSTAGIPCGTVTLYGGGRVCYSGTFPPGWYTPHPMKYFV